MDYFQLSTTQDHKVIIKDFESQVYWQDLKMLIAGLQQHLIKTKAKKCALLTDNTTEFVTTLLACSYMGVDILLPPNDSQEMLNSLDADVFVGEFDDAFKIKALNIEVINNKIESSVTIFTSGSSGKPKSIKRKFTQLLLEIEEINNMWGLNSPLAPIIFASTVSYQHIYGLLFAIIWPLKYTHIIWGKILPFEESLLKITTRVDSLVLVSSPAFLKRLTLNILFNSKKTKTFCSGGVLTNTHHKQAEEKLNSKIYQIYGSSETGGIATKTAIGEWTFFPSVQHKSEMQLDSQSSILLVKSPFCYKSDWLDTHDIIEYSNIGFKLLGRSDRIVKIEEKRISLIQIEAFLLQNSMISETHVINLSNTRQYLAAIIILNDLGKQTLEMTSEKIMKQRIKSFLRNKVEILAIPRKIRFLPQLPVNTQGKLLRYKLEAFFECPNPDIENHNDNEHLGI